MVPKQAMLSAPSTVSQIVTISLIRLIYFGCFLNLCAGVDESPVIKKGHHPMLGEGF